MKAIAIDGPAGAGKSTISKKIASEIGYIYVDTGALYRAVGLFAFRSGISYDDKQAVINMLKDIKVELKYINGQQRVLLCGEDVSDKIRTEEISKYASKISAIPEVREFLFDLQQQIAAENNVIMDGRDIGTVVLPNADVKIFLTASVEDRAMRRYKEYCEKGIEADFEQLKKEVADRDLQDSTRAVSPLKQADDAILVDTSGNEFEQSVEVLKKIITDRIG